MQTLFLGDPSDALTLLKKKDITQQASFLSSSTISRCEINPCQGRQACHSTEEISQFPFGATLSEPLLKLKKLLEQNCTPEKVQYIFQLIEAGNLKDIDWEDAIRSTSIEDPPSDLGSSHALECRVTPCEGHPGCHVPDEVLQYPFGMPNTYLKNEGEEKNKHFFGQLENRKSKHVNSEIPMIGSIDLQPKDPVSVSKLTSMSNFNPPSRKGHSGCHLPDEVLQYPFGTPLPPNLVELKKLIEKNESKEKGKELFGQLQASNIKTCETLLKQSNNHPVLKPTKMPYRLPPKQERMNYHSREDYLKSPLGTHLSPYLVELKNLLEQNNKSKRIKHLIKQIENANLKGRDFEGETSATTNTSPNDCLTSNLVPKISTSVIASCCSPDEVLQYPKGYLSPAMQSFKHILEKYYDPYKVQRVFRQIETDHYRNLDYIGALARRPEYQYLPQQTTPGTSYFCPPYTCGKHHGPTGCHLPQDVLQYPYGTELSSEVEEMKKLLECYKDPKVKHLFEPYPNQQPYYVDPTYGSPDEDDESDPATSNCIDPRCPARLASLGCHSPDEVVQYPYGTSLSRNISELKKLIEQRIRVQCNNFETPKTYRGFLPDNYPTSESMKTISPCHISPCQGHSGCHIPEEILQYPFGTPLPKDLEVLKKLLDHEIDPKKLKQLFDEIEAGNLENLDLGCAMEILAELEHDDGVDEPPPVPTPSVPKPSGRNCSIPPCDGRSYCHSPDDILQYPFGTPLPQHLEELKKLLEDNCSPETVRHLFEQIEAGDLKDFKYDDCGESPEIPVVIAPDVCEPSVCPAPVGPPCVSVGTDYAPPSDTPPVCPPSGRPPPRRPPPKRPPPKRPPPGRPTCVSAGTDYAPPSDTPPTCVPKDRKPAGQSGSLPSTIVVLPPEVYAPKPQDQDCPACHKPKYRDGVKMKCACSGKKKTVKINPPCPCELHKVPISKEEPGLKIDTRSIGDQCCICDEYSSKTKKSGQDVIFKLGQTAPSIIGVSGGPVSTGVQDGTGCIICPTGLPCSSEHTTCPKLTKTTVGPVPLGFFGQPDKKSEMGEIEIIGPKGGYVVVGPEGVYTQAGIKELRFSSGVGPDPQFNNVGAESASKVKKNCLCFGKRKKKKKVDCQCPSPTESDQEPLLLYTYADFEEARKQSKIYKSNLTQTTSGFKFNKKKKTPVPEVQYTMEDAIRDYAILRPDFIRELVPQSTVIRKGRKKDCACESDRSVSADNYEVLVPDGKGNFVFEKPKPAPAPVEDVPRPVLKISIGGKGSGSKGLSGICCFEMYQDF